MCSRRQIRAAVALLAALALLAGCRSGPRGDGKEHIRFSSYASSPAETTLMRELVAEFNRAQPAIRVTYEPVPGQYYPKMLTMLVSKTAPDVFYLDILYFEPFLSKGVLRPLNDFLAKSTTRQEDFLPSLMQAFKDGEQVYGIPKDFNTFGWFYNKQAFREADVPFPDAGWDLQEFRRAARRLTTEDKERHGFALMIDPDRFLILTRMFGGSLFDRAGRCTIDQPPAIEAARLYSDLKLADHAAITPNEIGSSWTGDAFGRGSAAMAFEGGWLIPYLQESFPELDYGVSELPRGPRGRSNFLFTVAYVIPQSSRHAEASWKLIEYLTSEEAQARITFALPSRKAVSERYVAKNPRYRPLLAGASYAMPYEFGPKGNRVYDRLGVAMQEIFLGGKPPDKALAEAADEIDQLSKL